MKNCEICGKDISERRGRARFCTECAEKRRIARNEAKRKTKVCEICGKVLEGRQYKKYCEECRKKVKYGEYRSKRYCLCCGAEISGRRIKYCEACAKVMQSTGGKASEKRQVVRNKKNKAKEPRYGDRTKCNTCRFYDKYTKCCDYLGITGMPRRCEPGAKCEKYDQGERNKKGEIA